MKKVTTKLIIVLLCLLSFACKKNDTATEPQGTNELLKTKIGNSIKSNTNSENELSLKNLLSNLKWDDLVFQKEVNGDIVIIPIDNKFKTDNNANNPVSNFLVFNEDIKTGKTSLGITQYEGESDVTTTAKSLAALYTHVNNNITGKLTFITLDDVFLAECYYTNGEKTKSKTVQENKASSNKTNSNCTTYYLLTTITIDGVVVNQELEYLYTICNSCDGGIQRLANPYTGRVACGNGNGGGGTGGEVGISEATVIANFNEVKSGSFSYTTNLDNPVTTSALQTHTYKYKCADNPYGYWTVWSVAQWTTAKNANNINVSNVSTSDEFEKNLPLLVDATTGVSYTTGTSQEAPIINGNNTPNPKINISSKGVIRVWSRVPITMFLDSDYPTKGILNINSHN
jgi:hypothetical protein